jgi:hypothetical protein
VGEKKLILKGCDANSSNKIDDDDDDDDDMVVVDVSGFSWNFVYECW